MNPSRILFLLTATLLLGSSVAAADAGDQEAIKKLEAKAVGYWVPDPEAMLDLYTKDKRMKEENAKALIGESKSITVEVERGTVHFFSSQGKVTVPYKIRDADVAKNSLTVIQAEAPNGGSKPLPVVIEEDRITVEGGIVPFLLKRIGKDEFKKRTKGIPELRG
jgi:hypothetical protein